MKENSNELNIYTKEQEKQFKGLKEKQEQEYIKAIDRGLRNQPYSELNNFIQYAIGDNVQSFLDFDENGNQTFKNGKVKYNYNNKGNPIKSKNSAEIVILNAFTETEAEKIEKTQKKQEQEENTDTEELQDELRKTIYKPISQIKEGVKDGKIEPTTFNVLLKKVELLFVEKLYNNFNGDILNPTIIIKDTELAEILKTDRRNLNRDMNKIIVSLSQVQIRAFNWSKPMYSKRNGKKEEIPNLALVNLIQYAIHKNGITQVTFSEKFAQHILLCNVLQIPKELYTIKDALTFDLILYLYGQVRQKKGNTFKIKIRTIYDTIRQIKRYEQVKNRNYQRDIYQPFEDAMEYLGKGTMQNRRKDAKQKTKQCLEIANVKYENTDFIKSNEQYDFDKWLDTNLIVEIIKAPNLNELRENREQYKKLAEKNSTKKK